jgi:hypothetical protein
MYDDQGHKVFDLVLLSSGGSRQFDTDKIIQRYDQRIAMSILSDFILLGSDRVGSYALGTSKMDLWSMAVDSIAKNIAEVINQHAIPRLLKLNGMDIARAPYLTYGEVSHVDLNEIAGFVGNLVQTGATWLVYHLLNMMDRILVCLLCLKALEFLQCLKNQQHRARKNYHLLHRRRLRNFLKLVKDGNSFR